MADVAQTARARRCDVCIIELDDRLLVRPGTVILKPADKLIIGNLTDQLARVDLRNLGGREFDLPAGQVAVENFGVDRRPKPYTYKVFVGGRKAHGESDPVIIIDP
jgi:hypothetical protein